MKRLDLVVTAADQGERIDRFLARAGGISRGEARRLLEAGGVHLDGKRLKVASRPVNAGQKVAAVFEEAGRVAPVAELPALEVLFEDEHLLAVNKPPFVAAQSTLATDRGSLTDLVARHLGRASDREVGLVHRLDRETSGVTIFGKTKNATAVLAEGFREGRIHKRYLAVAGGPLSGEGTIDAWIAKDPRRPGLFRAAREGDGVPARTRWKALTPAGPATLVECFPETGRTHQIRVHLASLNAPLVGDRKYGGLTQLNLPRGALAPGRFLLHAESLELAHPATKAPLKIHAPEPADLLDAKALLGAD